MHLVLISIIASIILLSGILFYRYIYPKKKIHPLVLVILLSFLPLISIFRIGSYESGDLSLHATRAMSFYHYLVTVHAIPKWSAELNMSYGDAYFEFIYLLPYLLISFFHFLGLTFINSVKLLIILSYIGSGITFYFFAKSSWGKNSALIGSIFYLFMPYHLVDMHFRVSIAETLSFVFIPLLFLLTKKFVERMSVQLFLLISITICLFLLTHQVCFVSSMPFLIGYFLLLLSNTKQKKWKICVYYLSAFVVGFLFSAFYWVPILTESQYIYQVYLKGIITFTPFSMLLYSPWRYGFLFQGHKGELSFVIGYTQLFIIFLSLYFLFKNKIKYPEKSFLIFFLFSFLFLFLMMLSISEPLWKIIPLINNFQFTYRLLVMECFFVATIAAIITNYIKFPKLLTIICLLTIFSTILNWGNRRAIPTLNDAQLRQELLQGPTLTGGPEPTTPKWVDPKKVNFKKRPEKHIETIKGNTKIIEIARTPIKHEYLIEADSQTVIKENTFFFPGWVIRVNDKTYPFTYMDKRFPGIISFKLNKGIYKIDVIFKDTPARYISKWISIISITSAAILYFLYNTFYSTKSKKRN